MPHAFPRSNNITRQATGSRTEGCTGWGRQIIDSRESVKSQDCHPHEHPTNVFETEDTGNTECTVSGLDALRQTNVQRPASGAIQSNQSRVTGEQFGCVSRRVICLFKSLVRRSALLGCLLVRFRDSGNVTGTLSYSLRACELSYRPHETIVTYRRLRKASQNSLGAIQDNQRQDQITVLSWKRAVHSVAQTGTCLVWPCLLRAQENGPRKVSKPLLDQAPDNRSTTDPDLTSCESSTLSPRGSLYQAKKRAFDNLQHGTHSRRNFIVFIDTTPRQQTILPLSCLAVQADELVGHRGWGEDPEVGEQKRDVLGRRVVHRRTFSFFTHFVQSCITTNFMPQ